MCHNVVRFDVPVFERILGIKIKAKLVDTLPLSWTLFPERDQKKHGLGSWGEEFGIPKPAVEDWSDQPIEVYINRVEEDVKINTRLWQKIYDKLMYLYRSPSEVWRYIDYITFKMQCAALQEEAGWKVDAEYCEKNLVFLIQEQQRKLDALRLAMPRVPIYANRAAPKKAIKQDGSLSKKGEEWIALLERQKLPADTLETKIQIGEEEGNPKSPHQIKSWLFSLGWVPQTIEYKKNPDGTFREIPQINQKEGKGICESIRILFEKEPGLEHLDSLSMLNHRIPILQKMLSMRDKTGRVKAQIKGLANTLRFQHADPCVNLPRVGRKYAEPVRGSLIADEGNILCGADMSSLEDRLKHHYIFPYDPEYVKSMMRDDYDPHCTLAVIANLMTQQEADFYVKYDQTKDKSGFSDKDHSLFKRLKPVRSIAKNGNYACQYGAYPPRLAITCGITEDRAKVVFDAYWKLNDGIKKATNAQRHKTIEYDGEKEMWLLNPVNKFWYSLRSKSDIFSTLVQGTASYVFDMWVQEILSVRQQLTAQFHDEIVLEIPEDRQDDARRLCEEALRKTNDKLKLNRELGIGVQFGARYSDIH